MPDTGAQSGPYTRPGTVPSRGTTWSLGDMRKDFGGNTLLSNSVLRWCWYIKAGTSKERRDDRVRACPVPTMSARQPG